MSDLDAVRRYYDQSLPPDLFGPGPEPLPPPVIATLVTDSGVDPVADNIPDAITITGTGFVPGSRIIYDGLPQPTTFVSDTELTGSINPTTQGTHFIKVMNPDGQDSVRFSWQATIEAPPTLTSVTPNHTPQNNIAGQGLTIIGTGFSDDVTFDMDGDVLFGQATSWTEYVTTYYPNGHVPAVIQLVAHTGAGGGVALDSNPLDFTVDPPV